MDAGRCKGLPPPDLHLDATHWQTLEDGWDALGDRLAFPSWHGRNANALLDSIEPGQINGVEAPYTLHIRGTSEVCVEVRMFLEMLTDVFERARERGSSATLHLTA